MSSVAMTGMPHQNFTKFEHVLAHARPGTDPIPRVFVVDGQASERASLEVLIRCSRLQPATFASVHEFLRHPSASVPCCLILDVSQDCNGLALQKRFALERPEMPIIFITPYSDVRMAVEAIKAGAIDFFTKPLIDELLLGAITQALKFSRISLARHAEMRALKACYATLTRRERQVMALVVTGMLNKQVGGELGISEITVKAHRGQVMQKMKADSLPALVKMAVRLRLSAAKARAIPPSSYLAAAAA
jgi:FixJ family two-component response regulator